MELVLDTNIYRNLVLGLEMPAINNLINIIKRNCAQNNIDIPFPIVPAMELIAHFNDEHQMEREECKKALYLLVYLSSNDADEHFRGDFVPPLDAVLENCFFKKSNTHAVAYLNIVPIAHKLLNIIPLEEGNDKNQFVETAKSQVEYEKNEIRSNYENYLKLFNSGKAQWDYFRTRATKPQRKDYFEKLKNGYLSALVAQSFVNRAYGIANKRIIRRKGYFEKVLQTMQNFYPALVMNELLLENIGHGVAAIQDVADDRWNTVMDISLIFGALYNSTNTDKKLVTQEKNIIRSFQVCGFQDKIINLEQFKELVGI